MSRLTENSKIKEIYKNPIGKDIINKILLQMDKSERVIDNVIVGNMKFKTLGKLAKNFLGDGFVDVFLTLLNREQTSLERPTKGVDPVWWKESVVYQIYPRSFNDSNGDGIGDLQGIIARLDYLKELGIDIIWLSPIYDSPNDDNGYDIRDYQKIWSEFGTMEDFDTLLSEVHSRGMKLIMDLVINHTSDEHEWFQESLKKPDSPYGDFYMWKKSSDENPPNNWTSFFSGPAWNYYKERDEWALHLFSKKQIDLNWENKLVRNEIKKMINWWLKKGIDGFRLDVINYISKEPGLPNGNKTIGEMMGYYGVEYYFYGPSLHKYLSELRKETFDKFDVLTVGETPGIGLEMSRMITSESRKELDMIFSFDHLENPGKARFDCYVYDLNYLKKYYTSWMENYGNDCWMSLFIENHDNPRMISKVNSDPQYREVLGKLLAMMQLTLKGTPFIFQGQELGMVNKKFSHINQFKDVESLNLYTEVLPNLGEEKAFQKILDGSRDHARSPMQWTKEKHAGFSKAEPWIFMDDDYSEYNIEDQLENPKSIINFYKSLIAIRKSDTTLVYGEFISLTKKKKDLFCYYRVYEDKKYYIELNISSHTKKRPIDVQTYSLLLSNYEKSENTLRAYEANLYRC